MLIGMMALGSYAIEVAGWLNDSGNVYDGSFQKYVRNADVFSEINPYWYNLGCSDYGPGLAAVDGSINLRVYAYDARVVQECEDIFCFYPLGKLAIHSKL